MPVSNDAVASTPWQAYLNGMSAEEKNRLKYGYPSFDEYCEAVWKEYQELEANGNVP
jgi:hypothetical protein